MINRFFITTFRNLLRDKFFTLINISGLAIGLAAFILITLYVYHELSFDRYHEKADRIYRVVENLRTENELLFQSTSSPPMGPALHRDFPEVESYVRFTTLGGTIRIGENTFTASNSYLADSTVFDIFSWPMLKGDARTALSEPNTVVLSSTTARKFFGDRDPLGETINFEGFNLEITGVMEDIPENSHFPVDLLVSFSSWSQNNRQTETEGWYNNGFHTYLLLSEGNEVADELRSKMPDFISRNIGKGAMYYEDLPLQALTNIYLANPRAWENGPRGNINNIYILSVIAGFILLVACFNYINLATARATRRMKEIGLKKLLGASRSALLVQLLGESLLISTISVLLGFFIAWIILPAFNLLIVGTLHFGILPYGWMTGTGLLTLAVFLGLFSGIYPALIISGFQPMQIFRPTILGFFHHQNFRKILVTLQFIISITLVAGTLLIYNQLSMLRNRDLGFNKEATLILTLNYSQQVREHIESIRNELLRIGGVVSVTASRSVPGESTTNLHTYIEMQDGKMSPTNINTNTIDQNFIPAYGIKMLAGRNFSVENPADDTAAFIINETAMNDFGWTPEVALGKKVDQLGRKGTIIGITRDFHYRSLHYEIAPLLMMPGQYANKLSIKLTGSDIRGTVEAIESAWRSLVPGVPFNYSFLDEDYDRLYRADTQLGKVSSLFSSLAIFVGCLGLLGLTAFSVERRYREIGIRKVMGATASHVMLLVTREIFFLILVAFLIAVPITWYLINDWLQNFTARIPVNPLEFGFAGIAVLGSALLTVSFLSYKAAGTNPAEALREE